MKPLHIAGMLALLAAPLVGATQVGAATATASLTVTATVAGTCTISAATLAFGTVSTTANTDASTTISYTCSIGTNAQIIGDAGLNSVGNNGYLLMGSGSNRLKYVLDVDSSRSQHHFMANGSVFSVTGTGSPASVTVYGRIAAADAAAAPAGAYSDTMTLTVYY